MGGKLLRLLVLLCAAVALLCSLASAEQGRMTTDYSPSLKLWGLGNVVRSFFLPYVMMWFVRVSARSLFCLLRFIRKSSEHDAVFMCFRNGSFYSLPAYSNHDQMPKFWRPINGASSWHVINPSLLCVIQNRKRFVLKLDLTIFFFFKDLGAP
jgi:hypothetical protein